MNITRWTSPDEYNPNEYSSMNATLTTWVDVAHVHFGHNSSTSSRPLCRLTAFHAAWAPPQKEERKWKVSGVRGWLTLWVHLQVLNTFQWTAFVPLTAPISCRDGRSCRDCCSCRGCRSGRLLGVVERESLDAKRFGKGQIVWEHSVNVHTAALLIHQPGARREASGVQKGCKHRT